MVEKIDRIGVSEVVLHRACFVCLECHVQLTAARYGSLVVNEKNGEKKIFFFCIPHYEAKYRVNADYEKGFESAKE